MFVDDLKFGWRQLTKAPGFTITAVLTLGLAIGANTAVFSMVDAALLKPLPYPHSERLGTAGAVYTRDGVVIEHESMALTGLGWLAVQKVSSVDGAIFSGLSAQVSLVAKARTLTVTPQRVSTGYFRVLGVPPAIGREFTPDEDVVGGPAVAVLSDHLWRTVFDGDPQVVGQSILLKGEPHVVIGVMPASFRNSDDADLWTPIRPSTRGEGGGNNYGLVARLKDGVSWSQASMEVGGAADSATRNRTSDSGVTMSHVLISLQDEMSEGVRIPLLLLSAAVALVLLVACVNLAGLLLARAGRRTREIATRLAVGGDRRAVARQLLIESLVLASCGGVAGLAVGAATLAGLKATATSLLLTPWADVALDARVLAVTLGLTALTAVLFGLVPAIQATRLDVQAALAEGGTRSVAGGAKGWPRRLLVVAEVALGVVLLVGAGLLVRTFVFLQSQPPGFDPSNVVVASASLEDARYESQENVEQLFARSLEKLRALPGVESAAISLGLPYERILNMGAAIVGAGFDPKEFHFTTATYVTPGYFETLRMPLLRGRTLRDSDTDASAPAVVVNQAFARRYFGEKEAVGQHLRTSGLREGQTAEIVGVVGNVQQKAGFQNYGPLDALPGYYIPFAQFQSGGLRTIHGWFSTAWIIREASPGVVSESTIRRAMAAVDPMLAISAVRGVDEVRSASLARQRMMMQLAAALGGLALFLAAIGIHALIASSVAERTREFGIRLALGATPGQTIRKAALPGITLAAIGLAIGCGAALLMSNVLRSLLWGVAANDPRTFMAVILTLMAVAVAASVLPALRIRRLDPAALLRE